ncbi:MAG: HTH domain-containing protein [Deinococcales bacterium]
MAEAIRKLERLLELVKLLQEKAWHTKELAQKFATRDREIQRDILSLKGYGYKIESPQRGFHVITPKASNLLPIEP